MPKLINDVTPEIVFHKVVVENLSFKEASISLNVSLQTIQRRFKELKIDLNDQRILINKYNMLKPLKRLRYNKHKHWIYECICDCGTICEVTSGVLSSYKQQSCGCLLKRTGKDSKLWRGHEDISGTTWKLIKYCAYSRDLQFSVSIDYIWDIYIKQNRLCAISKVPISFSNNSRKGTTTASLDRIDSSKGYIKGNVQWLHKTVQQMKWDQDQTQFIEWCEKIYIANNKKDK